VSAAVDPGFGRFAPSPTGPLHLGNLRTALLAWLFARSSGLGFLVRMEDLDRVTSSPEHERLQLDELDRLGLDWDGPVVRQSDRFDRYDHAIEQLESRDLTYPCWCTRREIADASAAPHGAITRYPGTCRELSRDEVTLRVGSGRPAAIRLRADIDTELFFDDLIAGRRRGRPDDIVLRRNDGVPAYNLAVVVDDDAQHVTQVVRGDDLLSSTPSQMHLAALLHHASPRYAHVPLVLGPDGQRLAKRHGAVSLETMDASAEDVRGRLATSLGLSEPGERPTTEELLERFDPARLPRVSWTVDPGMVCTTAD